MSKKITVKVCGEIIVIGPSARGLKVIEKELRDKELTVCSAADIITELRAHIKLRDVMIQQMCVAIAGKEPVKTSFTEVRTYFRRSANKWLSNTNKRWSKF